MKNSLELPRSFEDMTIKQLRNIAKADLPDIQMIQRFTGLRSDQLRLIPYELIEKGAEHLRKLKANPIERHPVLWVGVYACGMSLPICWG